MTALGRRSTPKPRDAPPDASDGTHRSLSSPASRAGRPRGPTTKRNHLTPAYAMQYAGMCMYVCTYAYMHVCMFACIYVSMHAYMHAYMYAKIYA